MARKHFEVAEIGFNYEKSEDHQACEDDRDFTGFSFFTGAVADEADAGVAAGVVFAAAAGVSAGFSCAFSCAFS